MRFTVSRFASSRSIVLLVMLALGLALVAAACGGDDDDDAGNGDDGGSQTATPAPDGDGGDDSPDDPADENGGDNGTEGGQITVGGETWTVVPEIQCAFFPGPVVYIAGHAAENPDIEITIDYDTEGDLIQASVMGPDDDPNWRAQDDAISMEIDDQTLSGQGSFSDIISGETVEGSFEVSC